MLCLVYSDHGNQVHGIFWACNNHTVISLLENLENKKMNCSNSDDFPFFLLLQECVYSSCREWLSLKSKIIFLYY